jgi:asparagine synthase (glutamine-hydrolysing)
MCGILVIINPNLTIHEARDLFAKGAPRGPDHSNFLVQSASFWVGFHRLSINGLNIQSNQPLRLGNLILVCNGEIYNSRALYESMGVTPTTDSDCEVILHLFVRYGIEAAVRMIDASEFAFVMHNTDTNEVYAARDPYGVRPLFKAEAHGMTMFGSELKMMMYGHQLTFSHVKPGTVEHYDGSKWCQPIVYSSTPAATLPISDPHGLVRRVLYEAVLKRVQNRERPMGLLLSGGLDSSIITALAVQVHKDLGLTDPVRTFSVGMEGSEDIKYAQILAEYLGTTHTNVIFTEDQFFDAIPETIRKIESYDTTTVRASVGNALVVEWISKNTDIKVLLTGEGADEVTGGYLYFHKAPDAAAKGAECHRLLMDVHCFDACRSDKSISSHGIESRTAFLDKTFVHAYLSLPLDVRFPPDMIEKYFLRSCFVDLLPPDILWRKKEAFSDGVSSENKSWYKIIQDRIPYLVAKDFSISRHIHSYWYNPPKTPEQYYYRTIFNKHYFYAANVIPYFWMPRFVEANDCSARELPK